MFWVNSLDKKIPLLHGRLIRVSFDYHTKGGFFYSSPEPRFVFSRCDIDVTGSDLAFYAHLQHWFATAGAQVFRQNILKFNNDHPVPSKYRKGLDSLRFRRRHQIHFAQRVAAS